jgi:hypothetical protein
MGSRTVHSPGIFSGILTKDPSRLAKGSQEFIRAAASAALQSERLELLLGNDFRLPLSCWCFAWVSRGI